MSVTLRRCGFQVKAQESSFTTYINTSFYLDSGCHADVGGGSHHNKIQDSLSHIPLRWMIKECFLNTGILFDHEYLKTLHFDLLDLAHELADQGVDVEARGFDIKALTALAEEAKKQAYEEDPDVKHQHNRAVQSRAITSVIAALPRISNAFIRAKERADILATIWDQLILARSWWVLEFIPMLATYQKEDGTWIRRRM
jgi:hypothetical protein